MTKTKTTTVKKSSIDPAALSSRQRELLDYITQVQHREHRMPSYREMGRALGVTAVGTVQDHLKGLIEKGFLYREARQLRLSENRSGAMISVPIIGEVAAGSLQDAFEVSLGILPVSPELVGARMSNPDDGYFALRVRGDSMIEAGILEGDYVIVRKGVRMKSGDVVVALWRGEATVKELKLPVKDGESLWLVPRNARLRPIEVPAGLGAEDFRLLGRVVSVQRFLG